MTLVVHATCHHLLDEYNRQIAPEDITGFAGSHLQRSMGIITKYINGVACK
jgi:hypothetical protein